jgi:hypothetical protein
VVTYFADLTPNPSPSLGEGSTIKIASIAAKVIVRGDTIVTKAVAPSPSEGEGWGGVSQGDQLAIYA